MSAEKSNREIVAHAVLDYAETTDDLVSLMLDAIRFSQRSPAGEKYVMTKLRQIAREHYHDCLYGARNA